LSDEARPIVVVDRRARLRVIAVKATLRLVAVAASLATLDHDENL